MTNKQKISSFSILLLAIAALSSSTLSSSAETMTEPSTVSLFGSKLTRILMVYNSGVEEWLDRSTGITKRRDENREQERKTKSFPRESWKFDAEQREQEQKIAEGGTRLEAGQVVSGVLGTSLAFNIAYGSGFDKAAFVKAAESSQTVVPNYTVQQSDFTRAQNVLAQKQKAAEGVAEAAAQAVAEGEVVDAQKDLLAKKDAVEGSKKTIVDAYTKSQGKVKRLTNYSGRFLGLKGLRNKYVQVRSSSMLWQFGNLVGLVTIFVAAMVFFRWLARFVQGLIDAYKIEKTLKKMGPGMQRTKRITIALVLFSVIISVAAIAWFVYNNSDNDEDYGFFNQGGSDNLSAGDLGSNL